MVFLLAALVLSCYTTGWAAPSLLGPTGLVTIPTADVLGMGQFTVGLTAVAADEGEEETILYANTGLLPRLEAGFAREEFDDAETETLLNAKLRLLGPLPGKVSLAVGMSDITDQVDRSGYVVVSHTLGAGLLTRFGQVTTPEIHVGAGAGRFDGLFGGVSTTVDRRVGLMAEYDGDDINIGARMPVAPQLEATVAALDGLGDLALGLSFSSPW